MVSQSTTEAPLGQPRGGGPWVVARGAWLVGRWVAAWFAAGEVGGAVGGEVGGEVGTGHAGTLRVCPRSMKLKGCSGSKGKKESEMAAALAGPCSAAAVARQSCNRMASKSGEGVPR